MSEVNIPESKWFGNFSPSLLHSDYVKNTRRGLGPACVFCLTSAQNDQAIIFPNHSGSGIADIVMKI